MSGDDNKGDTFPAAVWKSKAAEKLADTVKDIVHFSFGEERIRKIAQARADAAIIDAQADARISEIKAQTTERVSAREMRNQRNIESITQEALKALPPPDAPVSDEPVSEDFVYRFFDECEGVSNEQMQQIWGKLLAGEIVRPGSFHPRTLSIVKDMLPEDANLFSTLCRFHIAWPLSMPVPLVFDVADTIYQTAGLSFVGLAHLDTLGLISFLEFGSLRRGPLPVKLQIGYGGRFVEITPREGSKHLNVGKAAFTEAGRQLATLCSVEVVPDFIEYVAEKWRSDGHTVELPS